MNASGTQHGTPPRPEKGRLDDILQAAPRSSKLDAALLLLLDLTDQNARMESENAKLKRELETLRLDLEIQKIENEKLTAEEHN